MVGLIMRLLPMANLHSVNILELVSFESRPVRFVGNFEPGEVCMGQS